MQTQVVTDIFVAWGHQQEKVPGSSIPVRPLLNAPDRTPL